MENVMVEANVYVYGTDYQEDLNSSLEDVIEEHKWKDPDGSWGEITIFEHKRMKVTIPVERFNALEHVLEFLDEEYGDPDGAESLATNDEQKEMEAAEKVFVEKIVSLYRPWMCEPTGRYIVVRPTDGGYDVIQDWTTKEAAHAQRANLSRVQ